MTSSNTKDKLLDKIIQNLKNAYDVDDYLMEDEYGYSPRVCQIIKELEKLKEEFEPS